MAADGGVPETSKLKSIAGGAARKAPRTRARPAAASPDEPPAGSADKAAPTPFSNLLASMIDEHAEESARVQQAQAPTPPELVVAEADQAGGFRPGDSAVFPGERRWRAGHLGACVAGLIVVAGGLSYMAGVGREQPPAVASSVPPADAVTAGPKVEATLPRDEKPPQLAEPKSPEPAVARDPGRASAVEERAARAAPEAANLKVAAAANPSSLPTAAAQPVEKSPPPADPRPEHRVEARSEDRPEAAKSGEPAPARPLPAYVELAPAEPAPVAAAASSAPKTASEGASPPEPAPLPRGGEAEPAETVGAPVATHTARIVSAVRMRAGPNNSDPVIATVPQGKSVDVIQCRAWCEVSYAGQRGWVYKSFISPLPPAAR